jgi:membrane carboxypeptidase/penicillin-binding protein
VRRNARIALAALAVPLAALILYEGYALVRAKRHTQAVLAAAAQGELRYADLPARRREMLLRVEDPGFFRHRGIDFSTPGAGMTTITQSLVKHFYFDDFQPGFAKLEQSLIARFVLDPAMPKEAQLAAFLNSTPFGSVRGRRVTGFAAAARAFYGRELAALGDREFLSLVAMVKAPARLDPLRNAAANAERVRRIERLLAGQCAPQGLRDTDYEGCA